MKVLVVGATGYVGRNLIPMLWAKGHEVVVLVRNKAEFTTLASVKVHVCEGDLLNADSLMQLPKDIDVVYYLAHSMKRRARKFSSLEAQCAMNFNYAMERIGARQVIYISGLVRGEKLSEHMASRRHVERVLQQGSIPVTVFRVGIVVGAGSASFEIMRDLVDNVPCMITPKWVESKCQPLAIRDLLFYLEKALLHPECIGHTFELGGPDVLSYRQMLLDLAKVRGLTRYIIPVPVLTPYLSSLWLYFVTSTSFPLAQALVRSMEADAICDQKHIDQVIPHKCLSFTTAADRAFKKIAQNPLIGSWEEGIKRGRKIDLECICVPTYGVKKMVCVRKGHKPNSEIISHVWDPCNTRGISLSNLRDSESYHVLLDDRVGGHLILYATVGKFGEVWLEWDAKTLEGDLVTQQTLTLRSKGCLGKLCWYLCFFGIKYRWNRCADLIGAKVRKKKRGWAHLIIATR